MGGDYSAQINQWVNDVAIAIANWSTAVAVVSIRWLLSTLGQATEPDLSAIAPVYDRMLAISLLLVGAIIALALIERIAWGSAGAGLALIPRVVAATFFAYAGLGVVKYVAGYAALLATAWSPDFTKLNDVLIHTVTVSDSIVQHGGSGPQVSTFGLIVTAMTVSLLTVMVHLELVVRSALILTVTAFVPLVCVLSIWPRLVGAATQLASFMIALLLSKFVVATAVYVGFRLVVVALSSPTDSNTTENWMASGVAVLLIAAFSPLVLFQAVRIGHASAGQVARGWAGSMVALAPPTQVLSTALNLGGSLFRFIKSQIPKSNKPSSSEPSSSE
jgi:hypothetical protein